MGHSSINTYAVSSFLFGLRHGAGVHEKAPDCWGNSQSASILFGVPNLPEDFQEGSLVSPTMVHG